MSDPGVRVVLITAPDLAVAQRLAGALVAERLAACVNLVPGITSVYRWEDEVKSDSEVLLIAKAAAERCPALAARVKALHPYDLPEIVELRALGGSAEYLDWVRTESST